MPAPPLDAVLGGPVGRHAVRRGTWFAPGPWAYGLATLTWLLLVVRQAPCLVDPSLQYRAFCYSDISALWGPRGIEQGLVPYLQADLEYPVLTGAFIYLTRSAAGAFVTTASVTTFFGLTAVLLFACFLGLVAVHLRLGGRWDAVLVAGSPLVVASGLINWDMLPLVLTSAALLAWGRGRPLLAGVAVGLGTATKLYTGLLLVPIVVVAVRRGRPAEAARAVAGAAAAWLAVNVPVALAAPRAWLGFFTFNADRGPDLGSLWYVLAGLGVPLPDLTVLLGAAMGLGLAGITALLWWAPGTPRVAQGAFLVVLLFCIVNKVYSPQYMLWLLPLLVLARPVRRDWVVFTAAELVYWWAVWQYLGGDLYAGDGRPVLYWWATLLRIGVQVWLGARVVRDVLEPWQDPLLRKEAPWRVP